MTERLNKSNRGQEQGDDCDATSRGGPRPELSSCYSPVHSASPSGELRVARPGSPGEEGLLRLLHTR